jgi:hypothetical protein
MRGELLDVASQDEALGEVERDLKLLLHGWFDVGFLQLRRIDWHTPAAFLEKLIEYEAVHEITSWQDLKHRLASDRRLYAFVHPNMPDEPLIFVQVALCRDLAGNVQALLDTGAQAVLPEDADTAIFYSISNAQRGLAGSLDERRPQLREVHRTAVDDRHEPCVGRARSRAHRRTVRLGARTLGARRVGPARRRARREQECGQTDRGGTRRRNHG